MADFVYNIAKGRVAEFLERVDTNDPTNSGIVVVAVVTTETDGTLQDLDDLAAVLGNANTAEATNTNYARKVLTDVDVTGGGVDDTNDRYDADLPDQTWTAVAAGDNWTDLIICYDPDTTGGTDSNIIPLTQHDFSVTPNGGDITAQITDFFRAS